MESIVNPGICLFEELPDDEDSGGGAVSDDVILGCAGLGYQRCCWVLDLLQQEYTGIITDILTIGQKLLDTLVLYS